MHRILPVSQAFIFCKNNTFKSNQIRNIGFTVIIYITFGLKILLPLHKNALTEQNQIVRHNASIIIKVSNKSIKVRLVSQIPYSEIGK